MSYKSLSIATIKIASLYIMQSCSTYTASTSMKETETNKVDAYNLHSEFHTMPKPKTPEPHPDEYKSDQRQDVKIPTQPFKTKEGHTAELQINGSYMTAHITHKLVEFFPDTKTLPVAVEKTQNIHTLFAALNDKSSKYLLHILPTTNPKFLLIGILSLKGGMRDVYVADDSDSEDRPASSTYNTTLQDKGWPVEVYKMGNEWRAFLKYPNYADFQGPFACNNGIILTLQHNFNETMVLSTNDIKEAYLTIHYTFSSDKRQEIKKINYAEILSSPAEIAKAKEARRLARKTVREQARLHALNREKARIEAEKLEIEAKRIAMQAEIDDLNNWIEENKTLINNKENTVKEKENEIQKLKMQSQSGPSKIINNQIKKIQSEIDNLNNKIANLGLEMATKNQERQKLTDDIAQADKDISDKNASIAEKDYQAGILKDSIAEDNKTRQELLTTVQAYWKAHEEEVKKYNEEQKKDSRRAKKDSRRVEENSRTE